MPRFSILLTGKEFDALQRLARAERRVVREQAAYLISKQLAAEIGRDVVDPNREEQPFKREEEG
jgi:cytidylate kinase